MVARVVLKKAKTYSLGGRRFIKDVPQTIKGEENIVEYQNNAYFHVAILDGKAKKKQAKKPASSKPKSKAGKKKSKSGKAKLKK